MDQSILDDQLEICKKIDLILPQLWSSHLGCLLYALQRSCWIAFHIAQDLVCFLGGIPGTVKDQ